ncbi:MFS transporter [Alteromonadales bacterium alter-6D02]|nr:MFS transporter [Alteromonadales bacterium alter-6D02]
MLVVLYFSQLGYSALEVAMLFIFYEFFGVVTNLVAGYLGAKLGLNNIMNTGLLLQIIALGALLVPEHYLSVVWVMTAQALSGIAKDLNKMSAKSSIKMLVNQGQDSQLFKWVAILTGSKNALKGAGFFIGAFLLSVSSFQTAILIMLIALVITWLVSINFLAKDLGKSKAKVKFTRLFSSSSSINKLAFARLFLFAARDVWFVVALPVYLSVELQWDHYQIGSFMALWIIAYGFVQSTTPSLLKRPQLSKFQNVSFWGFCLTTTPFLIYGAFQTALSPAIIITCGLFIFGVLFAINSSLHSFLIIHFADSDSVSLDVGFYYMANASGRLLGTILSGYLYTQFGLMICLIASGTMLALAAVTATQLPRVAISKQTQ